VREEASPNEPVRRIPGDHEREPRDGIALCLSGGGFRAMLFHAGTLWRLSELGLLDELKRISSVSGGSIASGQLALAWPVAPGDFEKRVVDPLRDLASHTVDVRAAIVGLLLPGTTIAEQAAAIYKRRLFGGKTLQDLPDEPRFIFNATNLATGVLWRFSKPYMGDYRVGLIERPTVEIATAVGASAAFPPPLSPLRLKLPDTGWNLEGAQLADKPEFRKELALSDGGVYDNLGLETAWKSYKTILVADAGGSLKDEASPSRNMLLQMPRVATVVDGQVRALRRSQAIDSIADGTRTGAFWSIRHPIAPAPGALPADDKAILRLANMATRLKKTPPRTQDHLINWGYACCDAAVRHFYDKTLPAPKAFPYPSSGLG
jgi:NTE family protein